MKNNLTVIIMSLACIFIGIIVTIVEVSKMGYSEEIIYNYSYRLSTQSFALDSSRKYYFDEDTQVVYTDDISTSAFYVEAYYYDKVIEDVDFKIVNYNREKKIKVISDYHFSIKNINTVFDEVAEDLSNNRSYNYLKLFQPQIVVYVNQKYKDNIIIKK